MFNLKNSLFNKLTDEEKEVFSKYKKKFISYVSNQSDSNLSKEIEYYARGMAFWKLKWKKIMRDNPEKMSLDIILIKQAMGMTSRTISKKGH